MENENMKNKNHKLETIEDIFNCIDIDNVENFLEGFGQTLRAYAGAIALSRAGLVMKGIDNSKYKNTDLLANKKMKYIDDGKQENTITITKK